MYTSVHVRIQTQGASGGRGGGRLGREGVYTTVSGANTHPRGRGAMVGGKAGEGRKAEGPGQRVREVPTTPRAPQGPAAGSFRMKRLGPRRG